MSDDEDRDTLDDPAPGDDTVHPYPDWHERYAAKGHKVVPLPAKLKKHPPSGTTGYDGIKWMPSAADRHTWATLFPDGNIAIVMPADVIALDLDVYLGGTLAERIEQWGPLPSTVHSTSRDDGSAQFFYRVPTGLWWPSHAARHVEMIRQTHRYSMAPPSVHDKTGKTYLWYLPSGERAPDGWVPDFADCPALPDSWVAGITGGRLVDDPKVSVDISGIEGAEWLGAGEPCHQLSRTAALWATQLRAAGSSLHDLLVKAAWAIAGDVQKGHVGGLAATDVVIEAFFLSATGLRPAGADRRTPDVAREEIRRAVVSGIEKTAGDGVRVTVDPCGDRPPTVIEILRLPPIDYDDYSDEVPEWVLEEDREDGRQQLALRSHADAVASERPAGMPVRDPVMFHGLLGEIARSASDGRHSEGDPVGILVSLLAGVGALAGAKPHIDIGGTRHPLLVWSLLFGSTGSGRKGEATNYAERFLRAADLNLDAISASGLSSGEGVVERLRDREESKSGNVVGTDDKRLFLVESEFASVMARAGRDGSTLAAILRQAWDGKALSVLNRDQITASGSHVAIVAHIAPTEFRKRMSEVDMSGGTFNRFLPVYVERSLSLPRPVPIPGALLATMGRRLSTAVQLARCVGEVTLDPTAGQVWDELLYEEMNGDLDDDQAWSQFTRRMAAYARRISALYAALDGRSEVSLDDLAAAGALCRYSIASARYVLGETKRDPRAERLRRAVEEAPEGLTKTQANKLFGHNVASRVLSGLLDELANDPDVITSRTVGPNGGPPTTKYTAVRYVDGDT